MKKWNKCRSQEDRDAVRLADEFLKSDRREQRIKQLELTLSIVTTLAVVFIVFAVTVVGIIKVQDNLYRSEDPKPCGPITTYKV